MEKLLSEGVCLYCDEKINKRAIVKHLNKHLEDKQKQTSSSKKSYHVRVEAAEMFLQLLISEDMELGDLDDFLRDIWLECCGHMSTFEVKGKRYINNWDDMNAEIGELKATRIGDLFQKDMIIEYEYDMGSTTQLDIKVLEVFSIATPSGIVLLSRNEPLKLMCEMCGTEPAVKICTVDFNMFCKKCAKIHAKACEDFADYASMPICNSPRMGVCGYDGGRIDKKRDGVYKKKTAV